VTRTATNVTVLFMKLLVQGLLQLSGLMEGDDPLVHSMENLIVDKKPTEYEDPAIVR